MEIFGFSELQWLVASISLGGIFYNIGKYNGISEAVDYFSDDDS